MNVNSYWARMDGQAVCTNRRTKLFVEVTSRLNMQRNMVLGNRKRSIVKRLIYVQELCKHFHDFVYIKNMHASTNDNILFNFAIASYIGWWTGDVMMMMAQVLTSKCSNLLEFHNLMPPEGLTSSVFSLSLSLHLYIALIFSLSHFLSLPCSIYLFLYFFFIPYSVILKEQSSVIIGQKWQYLVVLIIGLWLKMKMYGLQLSTFIIGRASSLVNNLDVALQKKRDKANSGLYFSCLKYCSYIAYISI